MAWLAVDPGQMEQAERRWDREVKQHAGRVGPAPGLQAQLQGLEESAAWQVVKAMSMQLEDLWRRGAQTDQGAQLLQSGINRGVYTEAPLHRLLPSTD